MECDRKPLLKKIKRFTILVAIFLVMNFAILGLNTYLTIENVQFISLLNNKIESIKLYQQETINKIFKLVQDFSKITIENDKNQLDLITLTLGNDKAQTSLIKTVIANIKAMQGTQEKIIEKSKETLTVDVPNREAILEANFKLINIVKGISGSGTHIKLKGASYILTCAHLIKNVEEEFLMAIDNKGYYFGMELVKINRKKDLALYVLKGANDHPYLEISDIAPVEGSEIFVVGNPDGMVDVISDGIVAKVDKDGYIITNTIFFGNSGGAMLYKGKIAGVTSKLLSFFYATYGIEVKLDTIQAFLEDYK